MPKEIYPGMEFDNKSDDNPTKEPRFTDKRVAEITAALSERVFGKEVHLGVWNPNPSLLQLVWMPGDSTRYHVYAFYAESDGHTYISVVSKLYGGNFFIQLAPGGHLTREYVAKRGFDGDEPREYDVDIMTYVCGILADKTTDSSIGTNKAN